jgi:hypothetical protein
MRTPQPRPVEDLKRSILNTALTTHYECHFNPPPHILDSIPDARRDEDYMLSCMEASLPGTSLATVELTNDHTGITERHVHRRQYDTTSSFTFLVDRNYKQIKLFETWIGYIVNEQNYDAENYFYRVNFPKQYQTTIYINKFERDYNGRNLEYQFLNAYPISIDAMPVSYEGAQTLKCTVNFNFSRYITKNLIKPNPIRYQVFIDTQDEVDRDNEQYGDSVPQGSFSITGQGANRDANRHSTSNPQNIQNSNAAKVMDSNFLPFIK